MIKHIQSTILNYKLLQTIQMKKILFIYFFAFFLVPNLTYAQLTEAPNFNLEDINGNTWNLYDLLDDGKTIIVEFSTTTCGPCWNWHTQGVLEQLYHDYGPDGQLSQDLMIFYVECSPFSDTDALYGNGDFTIGDWVTGTNYPILDLPFEEWDFSDAFHDEWDIIGYPTAYLICPNKQIVADIAQESYQEIVDRFDQCSSLLDAKVSNLSGEGLECSDVLSSSVVLTNLGSSNLTSCDINYRINNGSVQSFPWTGNLAQNATTTILIPDVSTPATSGIHTLIVSISNPNNSDDQNGLNDIALYSFISGNIGVGADLPLLEDFAAEEPSFLIINEDNSLGWSSNFSMGGYNLSNDCIWINKFDYSWNQSSNLGEDAILFEELDLTNEPDTYLEFDLSHALIFPGDQSRLIVSVSTDCGISWSNVYDKSGSELATLTEEVNWAYKPNEHVNAWRTECVDLNTYSGESSVLIKISDLNQKEGNNTYIDNVAIKKEACGTSASINEAIFFSELSIYPNPVNDLLTVSFRNDVSSKISFSLVNVFGQVIDKSNSTNWSSEGTYLIQLETSIYSEGIYFLEINDGNNSISKRIIINH